MPHRSSLTHRAVDLPTLYLAGDSTVTDQGSRAQRELGPDAAAHSLRADIAIANHAESGETLKSFVTELRLDKLLSTLKPGDWVMIQFGHNDQKVQWPQTYAEAATTYRAWLRTYIAEIRRRGATPILVTSPERRNFDAAGHIVPTLGDYPDAVRAVAREESVALIDLNPMSVRFYEALGPEVSPARVRRRRPRQDASQRIRRVRPRPHGGRGIARRGPATHRGPREASRRGRRQFRSFAPFPAERDRQMNYAFRMKLKPGTTAEYKRRHDEIWPELEQLLREAGIYDYSIFLDEEDMHLFAVLKLRDSQQARPVAGTSRHAALVGVHAGPDVHAAGRTAE